MFCNTAARIVSLCRPCTLASAREVTAHGNTISGEVTSQRSCISSGSRNAGLLGETCINAARIRWCSADSFRRAGFPPSERKINYAQSGTQGLSARKAARQMRRCIYCSNEKGVAATISRSFLRYAVFCLGRILLRTLRSFSCVVFFFFFCAESRPFPGTFVRRPRSNAPRIKLCRWRVSRGVATWTIAGCRG